MKTVKRKYYSKKLGKMVERTYTYEKKYITRGKRRGGRNLNLVDKNGKVHKDRLKEYLSHIEDPADRIKVTEEVYNRSFHKRKLTIRGMTSKLTASKKDDREYLFINAGYNTIEEAADEIGVSVDELLSDKNWKGSTFTRKDGQIFVFTFNYYGSVWA